MEVDSQERGVDSQERKVDHLDLLSTKPFLARVYPSRLSQIFFKVIYLDHN